jgi:hypothetical protein
MILTAPELPLDFRCLDFLLLLLPEEEFHIRFRFLGLLLLLLLLLIEEAAADRREDMQYNSIAAAVAAAAANAVSQKIFELTCGVENGIA